MAFLSRFCNGELLFVNTRLSVKVKLSVFNLVKAIQSCREEVKISSKNVKFLNSTVVLTVITLQNKLKGNQQQHLFNIYLTLTGTSGYSGGRGRELEKRLSQNVFSVLTVYLADTRAIIGQRGTLRALAGIS